MKARRLGVVALARAVTAIAVTVSATTAAGKSSAGPTIVMGAGNLAL